MCQHNIMPNVLKMHDRIASLKCLCLSKVLLLFSIYRQGSDVLRITCQWSHNWEGNTKQWLALPVFFPLCWFTLPSTWKQLSWPKMSWERGETMKRKLLPKIKTLKFQKNRSRRENSMRISTSLKSPHWGPWLALAMCRITLLQNGHEPGRWTFLILSLLGGKITTCKS